MDQDWTAVAFDSTPIGEGEQINGKDFTLIPGVVVRGVAVDAESGHPLTGAEIGIYGPAHPKSCERDLAMGGPPRR